MMVVPSASVAPRVSLIHQSTKFIQRQAPRIRPAVRKAVIVLTLFGHVLMIAATLTFARLHVFIRMSSELRIDFQQVGMHMIRDYFGSVETACFTAAACHVVVLLTALQTYFLRWLGDEEAISAYQAALDRAGARYRDEAHSYWRRVHRRIDRILMVYPTEIAQLRLLLEISLQIFQARKMSELVAAIWLNRLLVFVIVINCWFTPLIFLVLRTQSLYTKRVIRLCVDTVLDLVYSIGLPSVIMYPYYQQFDVKNKLFPSAYFVMDAWTSVTAAELRQVFISSFTDFVSKVVPWFFVCYRLQALRDLLVTNGENVAKESSSRLSSALNVLLCCTGLGVLAIHFHSTPLSMSSSHTQGCLVEMRPWLATSATCIVLEISCSQHQIVGGKAEIDAILSHINPDRVLSLIISHCPRFQMPPRVVTLSQIAMFKIYNSTLTQWDEDALITATTNPNVQQFFAVDTNFTAFPPGLLSLDMPKTLRDVKFIATNMTSFPASLAQAWSGVKYFAVELSPVTTTASPALALFPQLEYLSFGGNSIETIPDRLLANARIRQFLVADNPISSLPEYPCNPSVLRLFAIARTSVHELPSTLLATKDDPKLPSVAVVADRTPLCTRLLASREEGSAREMFEVGRFTIDCTDTSTTFMTDLYPLALERRWREGNRYPS